MLLTKREWQIVAVNIINVVIFTVIALQRSNLEFMLYLGVIVTVLAWLVVKQRTIKFDLTILWGMTAWGLMHMSGGLLHVNGETLYSLELIPLVPRFHILRYDQLVHTFGFGVATLLCHHLLRPFLRDNIDRRGTLLFLVVLMGSGLGAVNEMIEFLAVQTFPETGVGGYENTMLDIVFNLLGGILAVTWLTRTRTLGVPLRQ